MRAPHPWLGHERLQKKSFWDFLWPVFFLFAWMGALGTLAASQMSLRPSLSSSRRASSQRLKRGLSLGTPYAYAYTGAPESIVVPAGAMSMVVDISGAKGRQSGSGSLGGNGGRVQATIPVIPGETLQLRVGGGDDGVYTNGAPGGYNGGGTASTTGGSGGGATDIRRGAFALADRIVVAAGGGGAAYAASAGAQAGVGSMGGGTTGANGLTNDGGAGLGGTPSAGGASNTDGGSFNAGGTAGTLGVGGNGGGGTRRGGGGGGGLYGGGGGSSASAGSGGSGGGGSNYTIPGSVNVTHTQGYRSGHGVATVTFSASEALPSTYLAYDRFNLADGLVGAPWTKAAMSNNIGSIVDKRIKSLTSDGAGYQAGLAAGYSVTAKVYGDYAGIILGNPASGNCVLVRKENGLIKYHYMDSAGSSYANGTLLASGATDGDTLRVHWISTGSFAVYRNGTLLSTVSGIGVISGDKWGYYAYSTGEVDNIVLSSINEDALLPLAVIKRLSDNFSGGSASLSGRVSPESGLTWTLQSGALSTNGVGEVITTSLGSIATVETGKSDGVVGVSYAIVGTGSNGNAGVVFRYVDANNYWRLFCDSSSGLIQLQRVVAGSSTTVWSGSSFADGDSVDAALLGDQIAVLKNGITVAGPFTSTVHQSATKHGIWGNNATTAWYLNAFYAPV